MNKKQGKVFMFDFESEMFNKLNLIDYPYEHFHPLGMGFLKNIIHSLFTGI
jgi:hypothetical protein